MQVLKGNNNDQKIIAECCWPSYTGKDIKWHTIKDHFGGWRKMWALASVGSWYLSNNTKPHIFITAQLPAKIFLQTNRNIEEKDSQGLRLALVMDNGAILTFDFETLTMTKGQIKSLDSLNILNLINLMMTVDAFNRQN